MSLNPLDWIGKLFGLADKTADIVKEAVTDKDKANEIIGNIEQIKVGSSYLAELATKTIPWIDGIHKMGRQILNVFVLIVWLVGILNDHTFTQYDMLILGGGNFAYQIIKGKGK